MIDESERLNRFIANLLDMTQLESGAIVPNTALHDLGEIVGSALRRAGKILGHHKIELDLAADLPMLGLDPVLFEQVLFNLLDNAAKYAPAGTTISIASWRDRDTYRLQIIDEGDGIPPDDLERVFDKFYRARKGDRSAPAPGSAWRSPAASSRRWAARSRPPTAPTAAAPCSPSGCRCRRTPNALDTAA